MHGIYQCRNIFRVNSGMNTVAQVEYMSGVVRTVIVHYTPRLAADFFCGSIQHRRIHITLEGNPITHSSACL